MHLSWFVALAFALTPQQADDRVRSMDDLQVEPDLYRRIEEPVSLKQGELEVTLESGVMVPVFSGRFAGAWENESKRLLRELRMADAGVELPGAQDRGDRELVGFVWLDGTGEASVRFPDKADAMELASRQVMYMGADRDAMREVARRRQPFRTAATKGVFLSTDPRIEELFLGDVNADPYEVVVYESDPPLGAAERLLDDRLRLWGSMNLAWGEVLAEERMAAELGVEEEASWLVDLFTEDRYGRISEQSTAQDRWLGLVDRQGQYTGGWTSEVVTAGVTPEGYARKMRISGTHGPLVQPSDPTSPPASSLRLEPTHADVRVLVQQPRNASTMKVEVTERVRFRANRPTTHAWVEVPRVEAGRQPFEWVKASLKDGTELSLPDQVGRKGAERELDEPKPKPKPKERGKQKEVEWERQDELRRSRQRVRLVFPEVLQPGEEVEVDLQWRDHWPLSHLITINGVGQKNLGNTSGLRRFLPMVDDDDVRWDYRLTVGLPVESKLVPVMSGPLADVVEEDGWRLYSTSEVTNARFPNVLVGQYDTKSFSPKKGLPAVQVSMFNASPKDLSAMAVEARAAMAYYARYLPSYGLGEYDVVETASAVDHYTWVAPHGVQVMQKMLQTEIGGMNEDQERGTFAHEVAHQWWGQMAQPGSLDDRWMVETFAEVFSCMYVAKAREKVEPCVDRLEKARKNSEGGQWWVDSRASASLEEAFVGGNRSKVVYRLGPFVMLNMLRPRVGTEAFFGGLGRMLADHPYEPVTNERLQFYLEQASGQDLEDFFDFWVHQGIIPSVQLSWQVVPTAVELEVTSDVPFGTFDIPVVVKGDFGQQVVAVKVVDGVGRATVDGDFRRRVQVELDPAHRTLTSARSVSKR